MSSLISNMIGGFAKSVALGQIRTALPAIGGGVTVLGVSSHVDPTKFEGALYYVVSSLFYIIPAVFSYLQKKSVKDLVNAAVAVTPGTPEADTIQAKVS